MPKNETSGPITIVLADDHQLVRQGLRALLQTDANLRLLGETGDGLEAVRLVDRLKPDVLVLDLMIPGLHGLEVTRQVRHPTSRTHVVILSMHADEAYVQEALKNGASGYVLKEATAADLLQAVQEAKAGRRYLSPSLAERAIDALVHKPVEAGADVFETLTSRERLVLQLAAEGRSAAVIGEQLFISPRTAETHRTNLMRKLGLHSQTDLVRYAIRKRILPD